MENRLYEYMNIPENCRIDKTVFKKLFYENAIMSKNDKEVFKNDIDKITIKYSLKEEYLNIPTFNDDELNYDEIEILEVNLVNDNKYQRICEIIQKTIPYPMIIVLTYNEKILINVAYKRVNKNDAEKNTVVKYIYSDWISFDHVNNNEQQFLNSINISKLSYINMYKLYCSFVQKIDILNTSEIAGTFDELENRDIEELQEIQKKILDIDNELRKLNNLIDKEEQFNRKVELNIKIKKCQTKKIELINSLR